MIISKRKGVNANFKLKINGLNLERCSSYKYLGLFIDEGLTWKNHIKKQDFHTEEELNSDYMSNMSLFCTSSYI